MWAFNIPKILKTLLSVLLRMDRELNAIRKTQLEMKEKMDMSFSDLNANVSTLISLATAAATASPVTEQAIDDLNTQVVSAIKVLSPTAPISGAALSTPVTPPPVTGSTITPVTDPNAPVTPPVPPS